MEITGKKGKVTVGSCERSNGDFCKDRRGKKASRKQCG